MVFQWKKHHNFMKMGSESRLLKTEFMMCISWLTFENQKSRNGGTQTSCTWLLILGGLWTSKDGNLFTLHTVQNGRVILDKLPLKGFSWIRRPHPPWFCLAQALISQNQRKNVKRFTNWAIEALVEMSPKLKNSSMYL